QELNEARNLYKALFATNSSSAQGLAQLGKLLDAIAADESENEKVATALLQSLGGQDRSFRAVPVTRADLAPAWGGASERESVEALIRSDAPRSDAPRSTRPR